MPAPKGRIHKRKDDRYEGRYTVHTPNGPVRRRVYGRKYGEVQKKLAEAMGDAARHRLRRREADGGRVPDPLARRLGARHGPSFDVRALREHSPPPHSSRPGSYQAREAHPQHVRALYRQKLGAGLSPRSVQYVNVTLKKALRQAVLDGAVPPNVLRRREASPGPQGRGHPLTPDQVRALRGAAAGDRLEALFVVAVHTGLRQGELLGLRWTDLDLDAGTLMVQRSLAFDGTFNPPKRKHGRRTVKLTKTAAEALRNHRARQNEKRLKAGTAWTDTGLVFPNRVGKPMDANNLYNRDWKNLLVRAGLADRGFTFRALRHTFATTLLRQNVNPKIVQHQLGHATISQTMDTYSHVMPDMGDVAADALEAALS